MTVARSRFAGSRSIAIVSKDRYYGGIAEKRRYGGQGTVTRFAVWFYPLEGEDDVMAAGSAVIIEGHGPDPNARRADAIKRFLAQEGGEWCDLHDDCRKSKKLGQACFASRFPPTLLESVTQSSGFPPGTFDA